MESKKDKRLRMVLSLSAGIAGVRMLINYLTVSYSKQYKEPVEIEKALELVNNIDIESFELEDDNEKDIDLIYKFLGIVEKVQKDLLAIYEENTEVTDQIKKITGINIASY